MTQVIECDIPAASRIDPALVSAAFFRHACFAPLQRETISSAECFNAIFGHRPTWMKLVLTGRNALASLAGLEAPAAGDLFKADVDTGYRVGDRIGVWPIYAISDDELVAGRDNSHLDFRVSVMRTTAAGRRSVVVSTVCVTHNAFGRAYLRGVIPFHRWGLRRLVASAVEAGRL